MNSDIFRAENREKLDPYRLARHTTWGKNLEMQLSEESAEYVTSYDPQRL